MDFDAEIKEKKAWREVKQSQKFLNAFRGLRVFWATTKPLYLAVYIVATIVVVVCGFYFQVAGWQWVALVFSIGLVVISETFNTSIEIDIDLTSPEYHPYARDTKDVAAAAALLSVFTAIIVGLIVFLPYFVKLL